MCQIYFFLFRFNPASHIGRRLKTYSLLCFIWLSSLVMIADESGMMVNKAVKIVCMHCCSSQILFFVLISLIFPVLKLKFCFVYSLLLALFFSYCSIPQQECAFMRLYAYAVCRTLFFNRVQQ